ncbi:MAG: DUF2007 domain-containing protein [Bacteroidota bacterium]
MSETFITVAKFTYSSEATIVKGRLESEGIPVFMTDHVTIDTDPLVSNAIGGVKLKVYATDEEKAREVLSSIHEFSLDDQGKEMHCPYCDSTEIDYFTHIHSFRSLMAFLFGFLFGVLPFYNKYDYRCRNCKEKFLKE